MCWNKGSPTWPKRTCTMGCYIPGLRIFSALQVNCIWIHVTDIREHVSFAWLPWAEWIQKTKSVSYADEAAVHSVESMEAVIRASEEEGGREEGGGRRREPRGFDSWPHQVVAPSVIDPPPSLPALFLLRNPHIFTPKLCLPKWMGFQNIFKWCGGHSLIQKFIHITHFPLFASQDTLEVMQVLLGPSPKNWSR